MIRDELIARIYEAALVPECWGGMLDAIGRDLGARGGLLFYQEQTGMESVVSPGVADIVAEWVQRGFDRDPRRSAGLLKRPHAGFLTDFDLFTDEERRTLPFYTEFLTPRGLDLGAGTVVPGAGDKPLFLTFEAFCNRDAQSSAVAVLNDLRPHLARAAVLSCEVRLREHGAAVGTLDRIGHAAAILGRRGQISAANSHFHALIGTELVDGRDRLRLLDRSSDQLFARALGPLMSHARGASIPVRNGDGVGIAAIHLVPVSKAGQDIFSDALAVALVVRPSSWTMPALELVQVLFDLTPAEAAVARAIAGGSSLETFAREKGKSIETVRSHLKRIYSKTGTARQNELAVLLRGFAASFGSDC